MKLNRNKLFVEIKRRPKIISQYVKVSFLLRCEHIFCIFSIFFWQRRSEGLKKSRWPRKSSQQKLKTHLKSSATSNNWNVIFVSASCSCIDQLQTIMELTFIKLFLGCIKGGGWVACCRVWAPSSCQNCRLAATVLAHSPYPHMPPPPYPPSFLP